jgi:hypothetical protein
MRWIVTVVAFLAAACVVLPLLPAEPPPHRSAFARVRGPRKFALR